jgi:hypothetical protein
MVRNKKIKKEKIVKVTKAMIKKAHKGYLKYLDTLWSKQVKERDGNKCVICGRTDYLNSHHLIPRQIKYLRHDINNGITLCPLHHKYSSELSAHKNPVYFYWKLGQIDSKRVNYVNLKAREYFEIIEREKI